MMDRTERDNAYKAYAAEIEEFKKLAECVWVNAREIRTEPTGLKTTLNCHSAFNQLSYTRGVRRHLKRLNDSWELLAELGTVAEFAANEDIEELRR